MNKRISLARTAGNRTSKTARFDFTQANSEHDGFKPSSLESELAEVRMAAPVAAALPATPKPAKAGSGGSTKILRRRCSRASHAPPPKRLGTQEATKGYRPFCY